MTKFQTDVVCDDLTITSTFVGSGIHDVTITDDVSGKKFSFRASRDQLLAVISVTMFCTPDPEGGDIPCDHQALLPLVYHLMDNCPEECLPWRKWPAEWNKVEF